MFKNKDDLRGIKYNIRNSELPDTEELQYREGTVMESTGLELKVLLIAESYHVIRELREICAWET